MHDGPQLVSGSFPRYDDMTVNDHSIDGEAPRIFPSPLGGAKTVTAILGAARAGFVTGIL